MFSAQSPVEEKDLHPGIQGLTEQIHRLLLQVGIHGLHTPAPRVSGPELPGEPGGPSHSVQLHPAPLVPAAWARTVGHACGLHSWEQCPPCIFGVPVSEL